MTIIHFTITRQEWFCKLAPLLKRLKRNVRKKRSDIIRGCNNECSNDLICSLSECCHNILKGNVHPTSAQKAKNLRRYKQNLRKLSLKKASVKQRKKILQLGGFLGTLIIVSSTDYAKKVVLVDSRVLDQIKEMFTNKKNCW